MKTFCLIVPDAVTHEMRVNPRTGAAVDDAIDRFKKSQTRETIHGNYGALGWVIGADLRESAAVYVVHENAGEKVTATTGSNSAIEALVNVLRGHGYTCVKRSGK